jgi:hypothetical protein
VRSAQLTVTNAKGCIGIDTFIFSVLSCSPRIPLSARIVTEEKSGSDSVVWVKAGGIFDADLGDLTNNIYFVDAGGLLKAGGYGYGTVYLQPGGSVVNNGQCFLSVLESTAGSVQFRSDQVDTFICRSLSFTMMDVIGEPRTTPQVYQRGLHLHVSEPNAIRVRISDLLGKAVLSAQGADDLDVDLSPLTSGIYFAEVQAGNERVMRKIVR